MKLAKIKTTNREIKYGYDSKNDFFVFDTETQGLNPKPDKFIFGVVYGFNYKKIIYSVKEFKKEFKKPIYYKKTIFAHNCEYDLLAIYGNIFKYVDNSALFSGSSFICATINKKQKVKFADSLNILRASVSKIGETINNYKLVINENYKNGTVNNITNEDIKYCVQDCKIIYDSLRIFFNKIGSVKMTIASSAIYHFRKKYLNDSIYYNRELSNNFFASYYGGRTEAFKIGKVSGIGYDINSLYPFVMSYLKFPDPQYLIYKENINIDYFLNYILKNYEGNIKVKLLHKAHYFGFLPYRNKKLYFPTGVFTGTYNFNELRYAIESKIVEIKKIYNITYSTKIIDSPFKNYVNDLYKERIEYNRQGKLYLDFISKLLLNTLYGKFAEKIKERNHYFANINNAIDFIDKQKDKKRFDISLFNKTRNDCFVIEQLEEVKQPKHSIPLFASYITSEARIILLKNLVNNINSIPLYSDTDSIYFEREPKNISVGKNLGEFKKEAKKIVYIRGLKNYDFIDLKTNNKIELIKGISKNAKKINSNTYMIDKYYKTKGSLRNDKEAGTSYILKKELKNNYDKRKVNKDLNTKPILIYE